MGDNDLAAALVALDSTSTSAAAHDVIDGKCMITEHLLHNTGGLMLVQICFADADIPFPSDKARRAIFRVFYNVLRIPIADIFCSTRGQK
jgi:hypothetical protein